MYKKTFFYRQDRKLKKIDLDEIIYLEASKNYTKLYIGAESFYLARLTLIEALELLPPNKFLRVHRSFAVAADHIDSVTKDGVIMATTPFLVPVSRIYYAGFTKQIVILDSQDIDTGLKKVIHAREIKTGALHQRANENNTQVKRRRDTH